MHTDHDYSGSGSAKRLPSRFADRADAAQYLADALQQYRGRHPLVLAIPRGALPMGKVLAERLDGELDVVLVHKLGSPFDPEYAIGAIDESGHTILARGVSGFGGAGGMLEEIQADQLATLRRRRAQYTPHRPPVDPAGRTVIVVDDGLATGATMTAALQSIRARHPAELICAVPVGAPDSLARVARFADRVVSLLRPPHFRAVSQYYVRFPAVEDADAAAILQAAGTKKPQQ